jgi:hypothetical protein
MDTIFTFAGRYVVYRFRKLRHGERPVRRPELFKGWGKSNYWRAPRCRLLGGVSLFA